MSYHARPYGDVRGYPLQRTPAPTGLIGPKFSQQPNPTGLIGPNFSQQPNPKESAAEEEPIWYEMELEDDVFSVALVAIVSQSDDLSGVFYVPGVWCVCQRSRTM